MQKNKGITLMVLVITIIVMLILAGVAISMTIGENGIFSKSKQGAEIYKNSVNSETNHLNGVEKEMGDLINQYQGEDKINPPSSTEPITKPGNLGNPDENGIYTKNSTINGEAAEAFNPEIPKGFKPVNLETANWGNGSTPPSEEAVKAGLVIEDEEGNQFVWVAVDGEIVKLNRYNFASDGTESEYTANDYVEEVSSQKANLRNYGNTIARDINAFKTSVATHGGYYIARYEASYGLDGKPNFKLSTSFSNSAPTIEGQLWNNITQPNATTVCRNMYDSNYGIISDLMNSYAWETAILFIQKYSGVSNYSNQDGSSINSSLTNTGENKDEKCHIHDMAGNSLEWITETSNDYRNPCVFRGGWYGGVNTTYRGNGGTAYGDNRTGFRAVLYL